MQTTTITKAIALGTALGLLGGAARANILELEAAQQAETSLRNHWTFEGSPLTTALQDKQGSEDLTAVESSGGTLTVTGGSIRAGSNSQGLNIYDPGVDNGDGAYATTGAGFAWPAQTTLEFLVKPDLSSGTEMHIISWIGGTRFYFYQTDTALYLRIGDGVTIGQVINGLTAGNTYYIALQVDYDSGTGNQTVDAFYADVTDSDEPWSGAYTLTQSITDMVGNGTPTTDDLLFGGSSANYLKRWSGSLDAIAVYDSLLPESTLQSHANLVYSPKGTVVSIR